MFEFGQKEARLSGLIRRYKPPKNSHFDMWVSAQSARWQRKYFVQIRRYQALECDDGMLMDRSDACWHNFTGFSFLDLGDLVGAAGFSKDGENVTLQYCWLHPFSRGRGHLKRSWPLFVSRFGQFRVSKPRTQAMQGFLQSVQHTDPDWIPL